jgi:3-dehydroquinate synthase
MVMAADMSARLGWMDGTIGHRTLDLLSKFNLPVEVPNCMTKEKFETLMAVDKKAANGQLRLILLKGDLGSCVFTADFDKNMLSETLEAFVCE